MHGYLVTIRRLAFVVFCSAVPVTVRAAEPATAAADASMAAVLEKARAGDLDGALNDLEPLLKDEDPTTRQRASNLAAHMLHRRGEEHFRQARVVEALADFDRELELRSEDAPDHWQRGIACYYADEYEKGVQQFELHQKVNPQDVENSAWHFLCLVRAPKGSIQVAQEKLLSVTKDPRVPMAQIQEMFAGKKPPGEVLKLGEAGGDVAAFYADLYAGLYYEALGRDAESLRLMKRAAENPAAVDNYMGDVARVHVTLRERTPTEKQDSP
jgi:lipoprotein NlpI